jgi:ribosomal protein S16
MATIYLKLTGTKPHRYDIVVGEPGKAPRKGEITETLGTYHPDKNGEPKIALRGATCDRYKALVAQGAKPTARVEEIFAKTCA